MEKRLKKKKASEILCAVLMAYIDDATGRPFARFYAAEDTRAAVDSFRKYHRAFTLTETAFIKPPGSLI